MYKIYALVNKLTGEVFYIGCTSQTLHNRLQSHLAIKNTCNSKTVIQEIGKDNVEIRLLEEIEDKERAIKCEGQWTEYYRKRIEICNIKTGNKGFSAWKGRFHTEETKQKMRKSQKGKKLSEETKQKISSTRKKKYASGEIINPMLGRHHTEEVKQKLSREVLCVETGIFYPSMAEATRQTGICSQHIGLVCRHKRHRAGGYHWEYVNQED